ncbi:hypothetical protein HY479_01530 [Candidatus Uhrbacteria bacterium]|nr:hypothetical protein [Candidatus Uhrbacteria bacterium]
MQRSHLCARLGVATLSVMAFGAGCAQTPVPPPVAPTGELRQPAPPKSPVGQPQIPNEASKVPRPY